MTEPKTLVPKLQTKGLICRGAGMTHAGHLRKGNEDSILTDPTGIFWAIADGMGGYGHGEAASEIVIDHLSRMPDTGDAQSEIDALLQSANAEIQSEIARLKLETMGATFVALRIEAGSAHLAWAGDCRAYLIRESAMAALSQDHTVVAELVREGLLAPENARGHASANIVTRAVGAEPVLTVDHRKVPIQTGDRLVLCSDGLTTCVEDTQILAHVQAAPDPDTACRYLVATCLENGAPDNVSVIVIFIEEAEPCAREP